MVFSKTMYNMSKNEPIKCEKYVKTAQRDIIVPNSCTIFQKIFGTPNFFGTTVENRCDATHFANFIYNRTNVCTIFSKKSGTFFLSEKVRKTPNFTKPPLNHTASRAGSDCAWLVITRNFFVFAC